MQRRALLLLALLGFAQYASATGFAHMLLKKHMAASPSPPAVAVPPVEVSGPRQLCQTVPEVLSAAGNFTALLAATQAAGLDGVLASPELEGTLFAPTDAAFQALLAALQTSAEELLANKELLVKVLSYHFVPKAIPTAEMFDGQKLPTLLTANATADATIHNAATLMAASMLTVDKATKISLVHPYPKSSAIAIVPSGGAPAAITAADIPACKVLVDVVDGVLVPNLNVPKKAKLVGGGVLAGSYGVYGQPW